MHTFGSDFQYMDAKMNFMNIDKLINYIMANQQKFNVNIKYSTINNYLKAVNALNLKYETKKDDFFPYAPGDHDYWTGYFTSRTNSKLLVKETGRLLQSIRSYFIMQIVNGNIKDEQEIKNIKDLIFDMEHKQGILQHHDAVSGTEKQHVNSDYNKILT